MNAWSPIGGDFRDRVVEPLGRRTLLEETYHWGWDLRSISVFSFSYFSFHDSCVQIKCDHPPNSCSLSQRLAICLQLCGTHANCIHSSLWDNAGTEAFSKHLLTICRQRWQGPCLLGRGVWLHLGPLSAFPISFLFLLRALSQQVKRINVYAFREADLKGPQFSSSVFEHTLLYLLVVTIC